VIITALERFRKCFKRRAGLVRLPAFLCETGCDFAHCQCCLSCVQLEPLCEDYPGRTPMEYELLWDELKTAREQEPNGVTADLNIKGEKRYWYATRQATKVRAFTVSLTLQVRVREGSLPILLACRPASLRGKRRQGKPEAKIARSLPRRCLLVPTAFMLARKRT